MNREEMFSALGGISEEFLNEAYFFEARRQQKRARILRIMIPAAALIGILMATFLTLPLLTKQSPPLSSLPENPSTYLPPVADVPPPQYSEGLVYQKHEDHAVIVQLQGDGQVAHIPQFLDNLPVTKVELSPGTLPQNYKTLSFNGEKLESLTLPSNQELTLNIGQNVTYINPEALLNTSLTAVEVAETNTVYASYQGILYTKDLTCLVACPSGLAANKLTNDGQEILNTPKGTVRIPTQTVKIADNAFKNNSHFIDITLPDGITHIGTSAFEGCKSLRSMSLPSSLEKIAENAICDAPTLGYLHFPGNIDSFLELNVTLPIGCQVYYPLAQSTPDLDVEPFIKFFEEAEECVAWFSRFHFIDCDWSNDLNGYYPVTMDGVSTMAELRSYLENYFEKKLLNNIFKENDYSEEPVFTEIDGILYMMPSDLPVAYTDGKRQYSFTENEDGSISVTVRVNVPGTVANICVDTTYLIVTTEDGYCFAENFLLPVEKWYPLYLVDAH